MLLIRKLKVANHYKKTLTRPRMRNIICRQSSLGTSSLLQNMRTIYQLALVPLILITSLAFLVHGMPPQESALNAPTLSGRDDIAYYIVYPKDVNNQDQAKAIRTLVESVNSGYVYTSSCDHGAITWFWGVSLTSENAEKVRADPNVRMCSLSIQVLPS